MRRLTPAVRAASQTLYTPSTLDSMMPPGASKAVRSSGVAARWMTTSMPSMALAMAALSVSSACTKSSGLTWYLDSDALRS